MVGPIADGIQIVQHGEVTELIISRPRSRNALRQQDKRRLAAEIDNANANGSRVIVITQGASKSFCAGTDISEMKNFDVPAAVNMLTEEARLFEAVLTSSAPVVAAVNGAALGAGCVLVCCCDLVVAGEGAFFGQPEVRNGVPAPVQAALLPQIVGLGTARRMLFRLDQIAASEALKLGLVHEVVSEDRAASRALNMAEELCRLPQIGVTLQKKIVNGWIRHGFSPSIEPSIYIADTAFADPAPRSAIERFLESRKAEQGDQERTENRSGQIAERPDMEGA
jgi:enoyl-CoA hydratase